MQSQVTVRQFHRADIAAGRGRRQHQPTSVARRSALRAWNQDDEPSPRAAHLAEVQEGGGVLRIVGELVISGWDPGIAEEHVVSKREMSPRRYLGGSGVGGKGDGGRRQQGSESKFAN